MAPPILYADDRSPPVRSVMMLLEELDIPHTLIHIDLFKQEHLQQEYLEISPQHTVPALRHDDLTLNDSNAILLYLVDNYAKGLWGTLTEPAVPYGLWLPPLGSDPYYRIVDRLMFNATLLFRRDSDMFTTIFSSNPTNIDAHLVRLAALYDVMETFMKHHSFMAGNHMSIADLAIMATVTTVNILLTMDASKWPKLTAWYGVMRARLSVRTRNEPGVRRLHAEVERRWSRLELTGT